MCDPIRGRMFELFFLFFFYLNKTHNLVIVKNRIKLKKYLLHKMIKNNNAIYILLISIALNSCQYENAEELFYSYIHPPDTTQLDTVINPVLLVNIPFNGKIEDESENKIAIVTHGSPKLTYDRFNKANRALYLNGHDQFIELDLGEQDSISVSFWFLYESGISSYASFFDYGYNAAKTNIDGYSGATSFSITTYYNNIDVLNADYTFRYQDWYHIYVSSGNENTMYVNTEKVGQLYKSIVLELSNSNMILGKSVLEKTENEKYFNGIIDDIKIYNFLLSEQEICDLYNEGITK